MVGDVESNDLGLSNITEIFENKDFKKCLQFFTNPDKLLWKFVFPATLSSRFIQTNSLW